MMNRCCCTITCFYEGQSQPLLYDGGGLIEISLGDVCYSIVSYDKKINKFAFIYIVIISLV